MNKQDNNHLFQQSSDNKASNFVSDYLPLITTLAYFDCPIIGINRNDPRHAYFEFPETSQLKDITSKFWAGLLQVEPKRYFSTLKEIKSRLYERVYEPNSL